MSGDTKAVFLSYAREDAETARRIADALRGFGVEVWFDQNELRGGDAWDQKIRRQIKECALFVPVISARTQEREEGYFRREWNFAVERMRDRATGIAFIVPVVVDDTREDEALVPEEFMRVQWTRLENGVPSPAFVEQVKQLLGARRKPAMKADGPRPPTLPPMIKQQIAERKAAAAAAAAKAGKPVVPRWLWAVAAALVVAAVVGIVVLRQPQPTPVTAPDPKSQIPDPKASSPASSLPPQFPAAAKPPLDFASAKSIAVLPFANLSAEKENEFFADGIHDDLITALAKVRDLKVISRTSTLAYRDAAARNLRKIAVELGVATVLEGSVQRAGNRVRINLQLIDARTDAHLWAETFNRELTDIFAIQAELVQQVAGVLKATLTAGEQELLARRPTQNQRAYDVYLRARILDQKLRIYSSAEEHQRVVELYTEAATLDPSFTLAHVQASITHGTLFWFGTMDPTPERRELARAALEKARALAPGSPEVRLAEGSFEYTCNNNWRGALEHYRAAEAGLPNDAQLSYRIAIAHRRLGEFTDALSRVERACELDPNDLRAASTQIEMLMMLRRYAEVVTTYDRYGHTLAGDYFNTRLRLLARHELEGDWPAYLRAMEGVPPRSDDPAGLNRDYVLALESGDWDRAERIVHDPRFRFALGLGGVVNEPPALHRAQLAWCGGRLELAAKHAAEAAAHYRGRNWTARQQPTVQMGLARAEAFAGRAEDALRISRAAVLAQEALDAWSLGFLRFHHAQVLVVAGRREEALEALRMLVRGPALITSGELRHDPILMRLKDDPRFEEILKSAKPL